MRIIQAGATSQIIHVFIEDSTSTTGAGLTGLTSGSGGLTAYYIKNGASSATAITLVTTTVGTWTTSGFKEVDATNMPGVYELHLPNAAVSTGTSVILMLKGAANMVPYREEIQVVADDLQAADMGLLTQTTVPVETGLSLRNAMRLACAFAAGLASGGGTTAPIFKSADISGGTTVVGTKSRVTMTADSNGNRSAVAVDLT